MYSGSRGILYTAPPAPTDETDDGTDAESTAEAETPAEAGTHAATPTETTERSPADD
ncbi:hypothetical protein ACFO5R_12595 [Halosolutus amylolyticus]|uniref:Uncharacterized protein n=1 Tax=Halosolutus amylolyticus TaxID=2932267 RepID=A0ABD5PS50_9EURY|nr:hypothetical protein [Halosolutus amylolyticus]